MPELTAQSMQSRDIAQRAWVRATAHATTPDDLIVAVERMCAQLRTGLLPLVGGDGYRALLDRAVGDVEVDHPAIGRLVFLGGDERPVPAMTAAEHARVDAELTEVAIALVMALIAALGRMVGSTLAVRMVDRIHISSWPAAVTGGVHRD